MDFNDVQAGLATLEPNEAFTIVNTARPPAAYLFAQFLPERNDYDYQVSRGNIIVRATMAGLVGMDSPYPEGGAIEEADFSENTAKIANRVRLPEAAIRKLQMAVLRRRASNAPTVKVVTQTYLNFVNKLILQPHLDTAEWLRVRAMMDGAINWQFGNKILEVDYKLKAGSKMADLAGNNGFGGSTSQFWPTIMAMRRFLKRSGVRAFITDAETADVIVSNPVNKVEVVSVNEVNDFTTVTKIRQLSGALDQPTKDARFTVDIIAYSMEADILDEANKGKTKVVPFIKPGEFLAVGNNRTRAFNVGDGGTPNPESERALGYTHIAPTTESGGVPGRWADAYQPAREPWAFEGVGVTNLLPVIEADDKLISIRTALP